MECWCDTSISPECTSALSCKRPTTRPSPRMFRLGTGQNQNYVESNEGKLIDTKGVRARHLRLYSAGNNANELNHYIEVAVYGRPPAK